MHVTVVVGAQFGSEGKGKVCYILGQNADCMVKCGGSNSGHTVNNTVLRQLPVGALLSNCKLVIPNGALIDKEVLKKEISKFGITNSRLFIGPNAYVIQEDDKSKEFKIGKSIGSTESGTGNALIRKITRLDNKIAENDNFLSKFVENPINIYNNSKNIFIEGTQGFGLSLHHSPYYPYVTSRDTTVGAFLSEAGIFTKNITTILVCRKFPIRVAGNSGPLPNETTWKNLGINPEFTSVTKRVRRVAYFDNEIVNMAIKVNNPDIIVMNHCDYRTDINPKFDFNIDFMGFSPHDITKIN